MICSLQKISAILTFVGWQFITVATLLGQSPAGNIVEKSPNRAVRMDRAVRLPFSDSSPKQNPLRNGSSLRLNTPLRSGSAMGHGASSPTIRQVSYQEDASRDESTNDTEANEFVELSEPDDQPELDDEPELNDPSESDDSSETNIDDFPESVSFVSSDVRAPIRNNPFAEARQSDPQGLLLETVDDAPRFVVEKYSEISGRGQSYQLAGYSAHRFYHNPLYFCLLYTSPSPRDRG